MSAMEFGRHTAWGVVIAIPLIVTGCAKHEESSSVQSLEGKVEKLVVNPDGTGKITVLYFNEKQNQQIAGTGMVTPETEILINGAVAKLSDIREGEHVRGEVRLEKKGGKRIQTVIKINVERATPTETSG